jgi:hypothetical protein
MHRLQLILRRARNSPSIADWRIELITKLASLQKPDGSWAGEKRWIEDNPVLATSYSILALQEAMHGLAEHPAKTQALN